MFGKKKSTAESMQDISDSLAVAELARKSAQEAADRAKAAADGTQLRTAKAVAAEQRKVDKAQAKSLKQTQGAADAERKAQLKSAKALARQAKKGDKNAAEAAKSAAKDAALAAKKAQEGLLHRVTDPKAAKRVVTAAKVIGPALAPVALKAATSTREYLDNRRARQLGVSVEQVGAYRGPTGAVEARLAGLKQAVEELGRRRSGDLQATRFTGVANGRIVDLTVAVRAAASMPAGRRRATISAVSRELDQIDADLMTFLVGQ